MTAPSPAIDLDGLGLRVNTTLTPWPVGDEPRRAGVSSFGMGGTNAHVIIEQAPAEPDSVPAQRDAAPLAWVVSGRTEQALTNQAARLLALRHRRSRPDCGGCGVVVGDDALGIRAAGGFGGCRS